MHMARMLQNAVVTFPFPQHVDGRPSRLGLEFQTATAQVLVRTLSFVCGYRVRGIATQRRQTMQ
jgi:hypothetical protein